MSESWIGFIPLRSISVIHEWRRRCGYTCFVMSGRGYLLKGPTIRSCSCRARMNASEGSCSRVAMDAREFDEATDPTAEEAERHSVAGSPSRAWLGKLTIGLLDLSGARRRAPTPDRDARSFLDWHRSAAGSADQFEQKLSIGHNLLMR
jgi:hypothetical protein